MRLLISLLGLTGWVLWGYTVLFMDPSIPMAPVAFYSFLFIALTCSLSRLLGGDHEGVAGHRHNPVPGLSHAAIVSMLVLFSLWLQSLGMLTPLNGILIASMVLLIELGFYASGGGRPPRGRRRPRRSSGIDHDGAAAATDSGASPRR